MKIKQPYNFILKQNGKRYALVLGALFSVSLMFSILFSLIFKTTFNFATIIENSIPSLGIATLILFIFSWVSYLANMYLGNQLGRSRTTMFISSVLSYTTIIAIVSLFYAIGGISFYHDSSMVKLFNQNLPKSSLFIKGLLWSFISLLNAYALSQFLAAIWARTKAITKVIIFIVIPIFLMVSIPRIVLSYTGTYQTLITTLTSIGAFFGFVNKSVQIGRMSITTLCFIILPLLIFSYLISRKLELKNKKS
ncbi:MAG: hypothetical protein JJE21_05810 [Spirochaetaceae bacterium]|nr:hypothetical protein [Spirochaetaceae bacterium]